MNFQQGPAGLWQFEGSQDWSGEISNPTPDNKEIRAVPYMSQNKTQGAPTGTAGAQPGATMTMGSIGMMPGMTMGATGMMPGMTMGSTGMMPGMTMGATGMMPGMTMGPTGMMPGASTRPTQGCPTGMVSMPPIEISDRNPGPLPGMTNMELPAQSGTNGPQMDHNLPGYVVETPVSGEEVYRGSLKALLMRNLGHYVVATFLIGMQNPVSWEGFLHGVGNDYIVIYQPESNRYVTGDLYSLKFVEFNGTKGVVPINPGYRRRDGQRIW